MNVNDKTLQSIITAINFRNMRQKVISSNIANAETPGYKAKRLDFEKALGRALDVDGNLSMKSSNKKHFNVGSGGFQNLEPNLYIDPNGVVNEDGNSVNRDFEVSQMADNKIHHDALIQVLNKKLNKWKYIVNSER